MTLEEQYTKETGEGACTLVEVASDAYVEWLERKLTEAEQRLQEVLNGIWD